MLSVKYQVECGEVAVPAYAKIENMMMNEVTHQEKLEAEKQQ